MTARDLHPGRGRRTGGTPCTPGPRSRCRRHPRGSCRSSRCRRCCAGACASRPAGRGWRRRSDTCRRPCASGSGCRAIRGCTEGRVSGMPAAREQTTHLLLAALALGACGAAVAFPGALAHAGGGGLAGAQPEPARSVRTGLKASCGRGGRVPREAHARRRRRISSAWAGRCDGGRSEVAAARAGRNGMAWRMCNGGGSTLELAVAGAGGGHWTLRSTAGPVDSGGPAEAAAAGWRNLYSRPETAIAAPFAGALQPHLPCLCRCWMAICAMAIWRRTSSRQGLRRRTFRACAEEPLRSSW